jgi:hypothetical protein
MVQVKDGNGTSAAKFWIHKNAVTAWNAQIRRTRSTSSNRSVTTRIAGQAMSKEKASWATILLMAGALISTATYSFWSAATETLVVENFCTDEHSGFKGFITEKESGKTFRYPDGTRFGFCLEETKYPLTELDVSDCDSIFGYVSNWSMYGPNSYPIGFEITGSGLCVVRNGSFSVRIEGTKR